VHVSIPELIIHPAKPIIKIPATGAKADKTPIQDHEEDEGGHADVGDEEAEHVSTTGDGEAGEEYLPDEEEEEEESAESEDDADLVQGTTQKKVCVFFVRTSLSS
jgi:hypothetical protein